MRYSRISADCHIDLPWIPPDLFAASASAALRDRMPYVADGPDGPYWTCKNGASFGLVNGVGPAGQKYVPGSHARVDVMAATGLYADGQRGIRRPTDPALRLGDMDRDGVDAEVIYGILGAATRLDDPEAANEMFRIYFDRIGTKLIDDIGVETLMWGSDYPHGDGVWSESSRYIAEQFGHLPADVTHKIVCENAGRFYGLIT